MNAGPTSERVFDAIKRRILGRDFHPGQRLDPAILAQTVSSSVTPVRDALHLLAGGGLIDIGTGEGFHIVHIDEPALKDMYAWNMELMALAIRSWPRGSLYSSDIDDDGHGNDPASAMAALCIAIARHSSNAEHVRAVRSLNDRLHALRIVEVLVIEHVDGEIELLDAALAENDADRLRRHLLDYHRRRQRKAAEIVRAYYRA